MRPTWRLLGRRGGVALACSALLMAANLALRVSPPTSVYAAADCSTVCFSGFQEHLPAVQGIDGYVRVSGTVSTTTPHFAFISVNWNNSAQWMEQGEMQGCWLGGCSTDAPTMFSETKDVCSSYITVNYPPGPPTPNYPFYTSYNRQGIHSYRCAAGELVNSYTWELRRGSFANNPYLPVEFPVSSPEWIYAYSERQGTAPIGTDRLGCDHNKVCGTNQSFGLHVYQNGAWNLWTTGVATSNPPMCYHQYAATWAISTFLLQNPCP